MFRGNQNDYPAQRATINFKKTFNISIFLFHLMRQVSYTVYFKGLTTNSMNYS